MTTLQTDNPVAPSSLESNQMQPKLDVFTDGRWTHSLELPVGKCTIGSSSSCQIRLVTGQVRPLHCLVVRSDEGMTATSWAPGILLNDREFTTAAVFVGDVLSIGNLQLKLALAESESTEPCREAEDAFDPPVDVEGDLEQSSQHQISRPVELTQEIDLLENLETVSGIPSRQQEAKQAQFRLQSRNRCRQLIVRLRSEREQTANFQREARSHAEQLQAAEQQRESLIAELETFRTETADETHRLAEQLQAAHLECQRLSTELQQLNVNVADRDTQHTAEVDRILGELSAAFEKSNQAEVALLAMQAQYQELQTRIDELTQECAELAEAAEGLQADKERVAQSLIERDERVVDLEQELRVTQEVAQDLEEKLAAQLQSREELDTELSALRSSHSEMALENERLKSEADELQHDFPELQQKLRESEESLQSAQDLFAERNSELDSLRNELDASRKERDQLANSNENLTKEISEKNKHNGLLEIDVKSLKQEWQQAQSEVVRLKASQSAVQARIEQLEAEQAEFDQHAVEALSTERDHLVGQVRTLQEEVAVHERSP